MTRRERLENRVEKREHWAQSREKEASRRFAAADKEGEHFYGGQPILVGHHSEKMMRAAQERIHRNGFAGVENLKMAEHHRNKAEGLACYLETTIFDDDPDAIERIEERVTALEKHHSFMIAVNKICKNKKLDDSSKTAAIMELGESEESAKKILHPEKEWHAVGFESWKLSNSNANIRRYKARLVTLRARKALRERAKTANSGVIIDHIDGGETARIVFSEKPAREILRLLREAGFRWSGCSWCGDSDKVPEQVLAMAK